jgi:heat shock protein HslJ
LAKFTNGSGADVPVTAVTTAATLGFAAPNIGGSTSCNTYNGTYALSGSTGIAITVGAVSQKSCPDPETTLESAYLKALPNINTWKINPDNGNLVLTNSSADSQLKLVYKASTAP